MTQSSETTGERAARDPIGIDGMNGLSEAQARRRLALDGPNELRSGRRRGLPAIVIEVVREPMFLLLVAAGSLYLLTGEAGDAAVLLGFVFVVMGITIVQERRTERAITALRDLSSPRALVIRDGQRRRIPGREVVRGDLLLIGEGDRVAADAVVRRAFSLSVDESLLTGEPVPVRKSASGTAQTLPRPGGDDLPGLFAGTLVASGQGLAEVLATGAASELGRIGRALQAIEPQATGLQIETARIVRGLAIAALATCAALVVTYALTRGGSLQSWHTGLLAGISMAMAVLPEEFPVVLTVFLSLGAWRISRYRVLTRRMPAIETLGAATVLCVDKTGTLTENRMALRYVSTGADSLELRASDTGLPAGFHALLQTAALASRPEPIDPMDRALLTARQQWLPSAESAMRDWSIVREYPLTSGLAAVTHCWQGPVPGSLLLASKGAPEAIAELCRLAADERARIEQSVRELAARGLRVLGVAAAERPAGPLPAQQRDIGARYLGLVAFEDPLRASVPAAVAECHSAGIRVVMITGDYPGTALSIARQAGLAEQPTVMTGSQLEALSDAELASRIHEPQVFARVVPEQKLRIVRAFQAANEVVAMTGDGVNDAPALKAAHIGIAMGARGTDVAREAASLVLLDDDFSSIVRAVRLGRRIYDNIRKAITFTLAVHVPLVGLSIAAVLIPGWPLLLMPVHIAFLQLIIDPSCSLVFEAEPAEPDVMQRPPRPRTARLFSAAGVLVALAEGLSVLAVALGIAWVMRPTHGADAARAASFAALVVASLAVILVNRSPTRPVWAMLRVGNAALWWVLIGASGVLAAVLSVAPLQRLFGFAPLHPPDLAICLAAGVGCLLWLELLKPVIRRRRLL